MNALYGQALLFGVGVRELLLMDTPYWAILEESEIVLQLLRVRPPIIVRRVDLHINQVGRGSNGGVELAESNTDHNISGVFHFVACKVDTFGHATVRANDQSQPSGPPEGFTFPQINTKHS
jgi:hypothetical protein